MILGIGGGVALVASAGAWRVTRVPHSARAPWAPGSAPADARLDALRHAILAPNPHNRQPWLLRLDGSDGVIVTCDLAKRLPMTDPFDRQITIGFGTFIELARVAASARGYRVDVTPFPDGAPPSDRDGRLDTRAVAHLRFVADPSIGRDPLLDSVLQRRTTRLAYSAAATPAQRAALTAPQPGVVVTASADAARLAGLRQTTIAAALLEDTTPRTWQESVDLMRIGAAEMDANPDGLFLDGPLMEAASATGLLTRPALADPTSFIFRSGLDQQRALYDSVPSALWITTPGNSRIDQLAAGAAYLRCTLRATGLGLSMHPMSQSLQEYPEMAALYERTRAVLGVAGATRLQMLARVGVAPVVPPAPRWPLEKHLLA